MVAAYTFRPAVRENTPLIIGLTGPSKSGKTYSALRIARGLAPNKPIIMLNAEGARGHQYADSFEYVGCDLVKPFRYGMYEEALAAAAARHPGAIIIDSMSHAHDGPGGFLEWHEAELDRIAGKDYEKRQKANFTAWIVPKAAENSFRYALLEVADTCPVILCTRAKEKLRIRPGKPPEDLGWQPIVGESIEFETIFTLTLPPYSKGVPDLDVSGLREPFDTLVPKGKQIDEQLGRALVEWAKGRAVAVVTTLLAEIQATIASRYPGQTAADKEAKALILEQAFGARAWSKVQAMDEQTLRAGIEKLRRPAEAGRAQEADRSGNPPVTRSDASHQEQQPAPKERPKSGDEPGPGLFPTTKELKPPRQPDPPAGLAGVDTPDEAQSLEQQIEAEKAKLERQPPDEIWAKLCEHVTGTTVLDMADPDALKRLLELVKGLVAEDPDTIAKVTEIVSA